MRVSAGRSSLILSGVLAATLASAQIASAQSQGPNAPTIFASDASNGSIVSWAPLSLPSTSGTTISIPTQYLKATGLGFAIPLDATVTGIEVAVARHAPTAMADVKDAAVRIVKGGVIGSTDRSLPGVWPASSGSVTYGGPADLWGETWTPADVNGATFGFAISAQLTSGSSNNPAVDALNLTVYYTQPPGSCGASPSGSCNVGFANGLLLVDERFPGKEKVIAKMVKGPGLTAAVFGNPVPMAGTSYRLCVYNGAGALAGNYHVDRAGQTCGASPCWSAIGSGPTGYKYVDKAVTADGALKSLLIAPSASKPSKIIWIARNTAAALPLGTAALLNGGGAATVQLVNDTGACFSKTFSTVLSDSPGLFKAK